jgi:hypothetical protein
MESVSRRKVESGKSRPFVWRVSVSDAGGRARGASRREGLKEWRSWPSIVALHCSRGHERRGRYYSSGGSTAAQSAAEWPMAGERALGVRVARESRRRRATEGMLWCLQGSSLARAQEVSE